MAARSVPTVLGYRRFSWDPGRRWFVAEASDLGVIPMDPLYDDACDVGFVLNGKHQPVRYYHSHNRTECEGEILVFVYKPTPESERRVPGCRGTEVHILND